VLVVEEHDDNDDNGVDGMFDQFNDGLIVDAHDNIIDDYK
jgi:hypothetical protein